MYIWQLQMLTVTALKSDGQENLRMSVDSVKAGAHEVSLFLTTYNVTSMQVRRKAKRKA